VAGAGGEEAVLFLVAGVELITSDQGEQSGHVP